MFERMSGRIEISLCQVLRALYLFKEFTLIFLLERRVLCVQNQLGDLFLKVLSIF